MSDKVTKALINLGNQRPELRAHIRPVVSHITKKASCPTLGEWARMFKNDVLDHVIRHLSQYGEVSRNSKEQIAFTSANGTYCQVTAGVELALLSGVNSSRAFMVSCGSKKYIVPIDLSSTCDDIAGQIVSLVLPSKH
jgi:hypothetical protein